MLYRRKLREAERVMSAEQAGEMAQLMVATVTTGTGKAARLGERPSAGKTGTTQDFRDAWFVGFTSDYVCGVWIGNDHNTPMVHATGGTLPSRMFKSFMEGAERGLPVQALTSVRLAPPPTVSAVASIDATSAQDAAKTSANDNRTVFDKLLDNLFGDH
jgi:penicillin-binding protein 1A